MWKPWPPPNDIETETDIIVLADPFLDGDYYAYHAWRHHDSTWIVEGTGRDTECLNPRAWMLFPSSEEVVALSRNDD